jgi:hypothetical protein
MELLRSTLPCEFPGQEQAIIKALTECIRTIQYPEVEDDGLNVEENRLTWPSSINSR